MGHARICGSRGWVTARGHPATEIQADFSRKFSLATATNSIATTVSASIRDTFFVPSCPANVPNVSRGRRLPCVMPTPPVDQA